VELRLDIGNGFSLIEFLTSLFEVMLHHVNILVVVLLVDTRVSDHADAE